MNNFPLAGRTRRQREESRRKTDGSTGRKKLAGSGRRNRPDLAGVPTTRTGLARGGVPRAIQIELGNRIRKRREKKRLTRTQFAQACHLSPGHFGAIERGNLNVKLTNLVHLARRLDTTVTQLLKGLL